ncbi:hypothetical protein [Streptomyces sp. NPDC000880]
MNKKIIGIAAVGAFLTGAVLAKLTAGEPRDAWCDDTTWIRKASSTYYYLYRNVPQSREEIEKSTDYGGWLRNSYYAAMGRGELPHGIDDELKDWSLAIQAEIENGGTVGSWTDGVLNHCRN